MEHFISGILSPVVLILLTVTGINIIITAKPHRAASVYIKNRNRKNGSASLSAMLTALAGTLGVGNISGVALAISGGGCGAVFWMVISSVFAMAVKYAEILLASHYRIIKKDGFHGGAPLYIRAAFKGNSGKVLSSLFSVLCIAGALTVGCAIQSGAAAETASEAFGLPPALCGIILAFCCLFSIIGGAKRISRITDKLVPLMSGAYLMLSLIIIIKEASCLPSILTYIIRSAFGIRPAISGVAGFGLASALRYGVSRGLISNEAGCGTAPFAHARADRTPAEQGLFGIIEVFIDTVVLCTATAISIIAAYGGDVPSGVGGMVLVCNAYEKYFGSLAPAVLCISTAMFAYGSMICWYYYGTECISLTGGGKAAKVLFTAAFMVFSAVGAAVSGGGIWIASDICFDLMLCINTVAILKQMGAVKRITSDYVLSSSSSSAERMRNASKKLSRGKASAIPHSETEAP
ncbi:MAG: amino acid carrier protein [Clostridia bacterium]|nr:amino acid carrier protein [Clostridia bacterium]